MIPACHYSPAGWRSLLHPGYFPCSPSRVIQPVCSAATVNAALHNGTRLLHGAAAEGTAPLHSLHTSGNIRDNNGRQSLHCIAG